MAVSHSRMEFAETELKHVAGKEPTARSSSSLGQVPKYPSSGEAASFLVGEWTLTSLPEEVVVELLSRVFFSSRSFENSLLCRQWLSFLREATRGLTLKEGAFLSVQELLHFLRSFPRLQSLTLTRNSVLELSDHLVLQLPRTCPLLESFRCQPDAARDGLTAKASSIHLCVSSLRKLRQWNLQVAPDNYTFHFDTQNLVSFQHLQNFRLRLTASDIMQADSEIAALQGLHHLDILNVQWDVPGVVSQLKSLRSLELERASGHLPDWITSLHRLTRLTITGTGRKLQLFENIGKLSRLRALCVSSLGLEELPESLGHLSQLTSLIVRGSFKSFPASLSGLQQLKNLGCPGDFLGAVPHSIPHLQELSLQVKAPVLPEALTAAGNLQTLRLRFRQSHCDLASVLQALGDLPNLSFLCVVVESRQPALGLGESRILHSLPWTKNRPSLTCLQVMGLSGDDLVSFHLEQFCNLQVLELRRFSTTSNTVKGLFESLSELRSLRDLSVSGQATPHHPLTLHLPPSLALLSLDDLPGLTQLPTSLEGSTTLKHLEIRRCAVLKVISSLNVLPTSLETLVLQGGYTPPLSQFVLEDFPQRIQELKHLRRLELLSLKQLKTLPPVLRCWPALRCLRLINLPSLRDLPHSINLPSLCDLPQSIKQHTGLVELLVKKCPLVREITVEPGSTDTIATLYVQ